MDNQHWQELDQYDQERLLNQKLRIKDNKIKDLEHEMDFLRRVNDDVLKENYALRQAAEQNPVPHYGVQTVLVEKLGLLKDELLKLDEALKGLQQR